MVEAQATAKKEYLVGEIAQQTEQGRLMIEIVAKPDGTAMNVNQCFVEILNKQDQILEYLKKRL